MISNAGGAQFGYEDHRFTPARTGRKKRKNRQPTQTPSPADLLDKTSAELAPTDWLSDTKQLVRDALEDAFSSSDVAPDVLCLGLGSPTASRDARAQLAFLLAVCDDLSVDRKKVSVFDPVFADEDLQLLAQRGLTPYPENREARHELDAPTIVFMPHCDLVLYENLFRENWSAARLPNILLIANRLSEYAESIPSRKLAAEHPCVSRLAPCLTSRPLRPCALYPTAFNNTAVQFVRSAALAERELDWWALPGRVSVSAAEGEGDGTGDLVRAQETAPSISSSSRPESRVSPEEARRVPTAGPGSASTSDSVPVDADTAQDGTFAVGFAPDAARRSLPSTENEGAGEGETH